MHTVGQTCLGADMPFSVFGGLPQVDGLHIGVIGESFGGLTMLNFIAQQPDLFAAAVDFSGPTDLITCG